MSVAAARRLHELPVTMAALRRGELSLDQVTPIVERVPSWAEADMCGIARCATVSQIRTAVSGFPHDTASPAPNQPEPQPAPSGQPAGAEPPEHPSDGTPSPHEPSPAADDRPTPDDAASDPELDPQVASGIDDPDLDLSDPERFTLVQNADGSWSVHGRLDADHGAIVDAALRSIAGEQFEQTTRRPSRAACLVELARRHLDGIDSPSRRPRYRVHYVLDERLQLLDPLGHTLPDWLRDLICCDADISVTWQRHGVPIAYQKVSAASAAVSSHHVAADLGGDVAIPTTSACCARTITASTTAATSASPATPRIPAGSCSPTATGG